MVSWGDRRLDVFDLGLDFGPWHKAWAEGWLPSTTGFRPMSGVLQL